MEVRTVILQINVEVPKDIQASDVAIAINKVLDEPPCDWQDWVVGAAVVIDSDS